MSEAPILIDLPDALLGPRILVRPYRAGDGIAMFQAIDSSRAFLRPWLPWVDAYVSEEDGEASARRCDARWRLREDLTAGIWDRFSGRYLGGCGLHRIDWDARRFEIGYWIRQDAEGKGYITEAARLLCEMAFGLLAANRVHIRCASLNVRSAAVPRRLGFVHEGTLENEGVNIDGQLYDMLVFGMTADRWHALSNSAGDAQSG